MSSSPHIHHFSSSHILMWIYYSKFCFLIHRIYTIIEHVKENKVIGHISIKLIIADPLTKGMPPFKFKDDVMKRGLDSIM